MQPNEVEAEIAAFVERKFHPKTQLTPEKHLFRESIVDSIGVLELVQFLEKRFGLNISPDDMVLSNFESIAAMRDFVQRATSP